MTSRWTTATSASASMPIPCSSPSTRSAAGGSTSARALPRRQHADDHRRLRRQQRQPHPPLEDRAATPRRRDRPADPRLPLPPGTRKWNKIEHRLFSFIARNWRGQPLLSRQAVVSLIAGTTSTAGLKVYAELDQNTYQRAIKIADAQLAAVNLTPEEFHGEWNYLIDEERVLRHPSKRLPNSQIATTVRQRFKPRF
jgi:hypothetical protein